MLVQPYREVALQSSACCKQGIHAIWEDSSRNIDDHLSSEEKEKTKMRKYNCAKRERTGTSDECIANNESANNTTKNRRYIVHKNGI